MLPGKENDLLAGKLLTLLSNASLHPEGRGRNPLIDMTRLGESQQEHARAGYLQDALYTALQLDVDKDGDLELDSEGVDDEVDPPGRSDVVLLEIVPPAPGGISTTISMTTTQG